MQGKISTIFLLLFTLITANVFAQIPAFPGAQGWGAPSVGGRGGIVIEVTNLNDSGPGSFREACSTTGARTIVFRTGGVTELLSEIQINNPKIYIAGQTAPGDGIVLKNFPISIFTHDVTIRGMRIRIGDNFPNQSPDNRDCITVEDGSYNVIIDHCSFSWGLDENTSILGTGVNSVTIQWCIISEGLYGGIHPKGFHSMGLLIGYGASKTSIHHNLFAHNGGRNPLIARNTDHEFVNNLVYDWKYSSDLLRQGTQFKLDFTGNYYKPFTYSPAPELPLHLDFDSSTAFGSKLYMKNNFLSPADSFITQSQLAAFGANASLFSGTSLLSQSSTIIPQTPFQAYDTVLTWAGAQHPKRDATDNRVIKSVIDSTGGLVDCISSAPILLDSGNVVGATDSTIKYSMLGKAIVYSAESRKIVITSGPGSGQIRYGALGAPVLIDTANMIFESKINAFWTTKPTSSSTYKFYAGCQNVVGGYPTYLAGTPPADSDHDGMPDTWETAKGLNPNNATDRNGTNLSGSGYTNLEVYLNELYVPKTNTGISNIAGQNNFKISIYPNPTSTFTTIRSNTNLQSAKCIMYNVFGQEIKNIKNISGREIKLQCADLVSGLYFIRLIQDNKTIATDKLIIAN